MCASGGAESSPEVPSEQGDKTIRIKILTKAYGSTSMVDEYFLSTFPVLGSMRYVLWHHLLHAEDLSEVAQNLLKKALKADE
jgi:hypothetical protein